jgi:nucleotide-binding universal stress UspA family protein
MYKRILVATDGHALSDKAVSTAIQMAKLCGAQLIALSVVPHYIAYYSEGAIMADNVDAVKVEAQWMAAAKKVVEAVKSLASAQAVAASAMAIHSDLVAETVVSTAESQGCDLIVMASHGRRGIKRLLLGSETQHVLTHSTIAVLVLR